MEMMDGIRFLESCVSDAETGLPEEIFLFATRLTPMVNVDLLVRDRGGRILLSWRDDEFSGKGWHVPGGIVRLNETRAERIRRTAMTELGCEVDFDPVPLECLELIAKSMPSRSHFITFVYDCRLSSEMPFSEPRRGEYAKGELAWHARWPENMIAFHDFYRKYFNSRETPWT